MSVPPDVRLPYAPPWFALLHTDDDVPAWAERVAAAAWDAAGVRASQAQGQWLTGHLVQLEATLRDRLGLGAFLLLPEPETGVSAVVRLQGLDLDVPYTGKALVEGLTLAAERLAGPPETGTLASPAGTAHRLRQRPVDEQGQVSETVQYVWAFPERPAALVFGTAFPDLLEARRWEAPLDQLAAGLELDEDDARDSGGADG